MKFNGKLIAGALSAVMTISFASIAAGAVDYSEDPDYGLVPEKPADVVTADVIAEAVKEDDAVIFVGNDKAVINEEAIAAIANSDNTVYFTNDNCVITIEDIETVSEINLAMAIDVVVDEESDYPVNSIVIAPAQKGEFGMTLVVTIPFTVLEDLDAEKAALYYVADDGSITKMPEALTFDELGNAIIRISHASEYVISTVDISTPANNNTTPGESNGNTTNPDTGAVIPMGIAAIAGASAVVAIVAAKKRK